MNYFADSDSLVEDVRKFLEESNSVDIGPYKTAHKKAPSNKHYGRWSFSVGIRPAAVDFDKDADKIIEVSGVYKDALAAAKKQAKEKGMTGTIYPMP